MKIIKLLHDTHSLDMVAKIGAKLFSFKDLVNGIRDLVKMSEENLQRNEWCVQTFGSTEALLKEFDDMVILVDSLLTDFPPVFTHNDPHMLNIVYDEKTDKVTLLDWETAGMCSEVMDIAAHWHTDTMGQLKAAGMDMCSMTTYKRQFLKDYLTTHPKYQDKVITDDLIDRWLVGCNKAAYAQCFANMAWALCQENTVDNEFDYPEFGKQCYQDAEKLKKQF